MRFALAFTAAALLGAGPATAQTGPEAEADIPVNQLVVYGEDACPDGGPDVIVVCARMPEDDRFRIPEIVRGDPNDPAGQSWANRARELEYVGASGIGSCSTVGPGGFTGCRNELVRQARAERRGRDAVNWANLIDQARQERLAKIDAQAAEEEAEAVARGE